MKELREAYVRYGYEMKEPSTEVERVQALEKKGVLCIHEGDCVAVHSGGEEVWIATVSELWLHRGSGATRYL